MAKKSKKNRRNKIKPGILQPAEILKQFKLHWINKDWEKALVSYRTWCNRSSNKRDPQIEGELLFRISSACFGNKQYEKAVAFLLESEKVNPEIEKNAAYCRGIALAGSGRLVEARDVFSELEELYHRDILQYYLDKGLTIPGSIAWDPAFPKNIIQEFWRDLDEPEENRTSSTALTNIKKAYSLFSSGENPASTLALLEKKEGFRDIAVYLKFLAAVSFDGDIRIRNILQKYPDIFSDGRGNRLLDIYLGKLLKEKKYREITVLYDILEEIHAESPLLESANNTALFYRGLEDIRKGRLAKAHEIFERITEETPKVLHNKALINQKTGHYLKANESWIRLWGKTRKVKRSDSKSVRESYAVMLRHIAGNYLKESVSGKAAGFYKEVLTLVENDRESLEALQEIYREEGNRQLSINYAKRLFELDDENEEYLYNYTSALLDSEKFEELIPLYEEACRRQPESLFYRESLEFCYTKKALEIRTESLDEVKNLLEKINALSKVKTFHVHYLEGYILHKEGHPRKAMKKINSAMKMADNHYYAHHLAGELYEDGFITQGMKLFEETASCGCPESEALTDISVGFLADRDDRVHATLLCEIGKGSFQWDNNFIADMLYFYKQPQWALEYSEKTIRKTHADEDDRYLHLLILNAIGNGRETLRFAREWLEKARIEENRDDIFIMKNIMKEIKTRGRFRPPEEHD